MLLDGIKVISPTGWVLVVPDPEEPTTHVWAEGADRADSERLSLGYVERCARCWRVTPAPRRATSSHEQSGV